MSKKKIPSDPDFEYHLWSDENGKKHMRIKATGLECEINEGTFKLLSAELMRIKRDKNPNIGRKSEEFQPIFLVLSLDVFSNSEWLTDEKDYIEEVDTYLLQSAFIELLTDKQREVYLKCLLGGMSTVDFAKEHSTSDRAVRYIIEAIRKKADKFLF